MPRSRIGTLVVESAPRHPLSSGFMVIDAASDFIAPQWGKIASTNHS